MIEYKNEIDSHLFKNIYIVGTNIKKLTDWSTLMLHISQTTK